MLEIVYKNPSKLRKESRSPEDPTKKDESGERDDPANDAASDLAPMATVQRTREFGTQQSANDPSKHSAYEKAEQPDGRISENQSDVLFDNRRRNANRK